jgi:uncharacterized protein (DUF427 family)
MKAIWNGKVVAESDKTVVVENNHYFPPSALKSEYFEDSDRHTVCPWKGTASYKDVVVDGKISDGGAWYYSDPKPAADNIRGYYAFWRGVKVEP